MFDDEECVGGLLKSLISTRGLQTTWQSVTKRLHALEQGLQQIRQNIDDIPQQYVKQEEFHKLVETHHAVHRHEQMLKQHAKIINNLTGSNEQNSLGMNNLPTLQSQEQLEKRFQAKLDTVETSARDFRAEVMCQMKTSSGKLSDHLDEVCLQAEQLKRQVEDGFEEAAQSIRTAEHTMQISTDQKIDKMIQNLVYNKSSPEASQLLSFVSKSLVQPLAAEVTRVGGEIDTVTQNFAKQENLFDFIQRSQEKAMSEMAANLQDTSKEFEEQLNLCSKKVDADQSKRELRRDFDAISRDNDDLRWKVAEKLNEFVLHLEKVHTKIYDHEHCLKHHAEEIENRSTKFDLLICRNQIEKCVSQDEFHREFGELKKIVNWQSGKLENSGLLVGSMRPNKNRRQGKKNAMLSVRSSADGESSSEASYGGTSPIAHQPVMPRPKIPPETHESVQPMLSNVEEADEVFADGESEPQGASTRVSVNDSGHDDSDESSSEHSVSGSTLVMRQQLEAVAMGLLGIAHLTLKEVRLGTSRNARLAQEKEMLEELANVRHWITNRFVPSGWDPSKITTLALRCTHPREDELRGPSPQVSLKNLLELNDKAHMLQKRNLSLDPKAGGNVPGDSGVGIASKPPLSAKGNPMRLPRLEGLGMSN